MAGGAAAGEYSLDRVAGWRGRPAGGFDRLRHPLYGLVPTAAFLAAVTAGLLSGVSAFVALGYGALAWGLVTFAAQQMGLLNA